MVGKAVQFVRFSIKCISLGEIQLKRAADLLPIYCTYSQVYECVKFTSDPHIHMYLYNIVLGCEDNS
jgi:hypothetical protein